MWLLAFLLVLLVASAGVGLGVAALLRRRGVPKRAATFSGLAAGLAGGATVFMYAFGQFAHALNDTGPDVYSFSPYEKYYDLGGLTEAALIAGYAAIPVLLVGLGVLFGAYRRSLPGIALCVAGGLAIFLPFIVPGQLEAYKVSETEVLHTFWSGEPRGDVVTTCMEYGIVSDDLPGEAGLCIDLARTPRSEELIDLADSDELGIGDVTDALNERRVQPRDDPGDLDDLGLEVVDHRWYDGPPPRS